MLFVTILPLFWPYFRPHQRDIKRLRNTLFAEFRRIQSSLSRAESEYTKIWQPLRRIIELSFEIYGYFQEISDTSQEFNDTGDFLRFDDMTLPYLIEAEEFDSIQYRF